MQTLCVKRIAARQHIGYVVAVIQHVEFLNRLRLLDAYSLEIMKTSSIS
jgi:hypothetical protein